MLNEMGRGLSLGPAQVGGVHNYYTIFEDRFLQLIFDLRVNDL